jgi:hypothetical protein
MATLSARARAQPSSKRLRRGSGPCTPTAHYAPPVTQSRAVLTIVHNEATFFPIWWNYYSRFFAPDDIYVLDHETTDGSTSGTGFVRIPVEHDCVDMRWLRDTIQAHQHELMGRYDVVLITDVDEIVAPDPAIGSLGDYIDGFDKPFVNCMGFELLHQRDAEPPYDPSCPILEQRHMWFQNFAYSKPVLAREPMEWHLGFHARMDGKADFDKSLHLIHLHRMDYDLCLARHRMRRGMEWSERDLAKGRAYQNLITELEEFDRWFNEDSCNSLLQIELEPIPERWRSVV